MSTSMCANRVRRGSYLVPCGECAACVQRAKGTELATAMFEVLASDVAFRLDQTFRDEPSLEDGRAQISLWLHALQKRYGSESLRYIAAAEYGTKGNRLHFHIIMCFSGPKGSAVTVRSIRAEARAKFGVNTGRLLKRPNDPRSVHARAHVVAYTLKQITAYALKGSKTPAPFARDANGVQIRDAKNRPVRERIRRFTRSNGWGKAAASKILGRGLVAECIAAFRGVGIEPVFAGLRDADGTRYWLPAKSNPLPPAKGHGVQLLGEGESLFTDEERALAASNPVVDGYASGERYSFDPATRSAAEAAHGRSKYQVDRPKSGLLFPSGASALRDETSDEFIARMLGKQASKDAAEAARKAAGLSDDDASPDDDLGPAGFGENPSPLPQQNVRKHSRLPPMSYERREKTLNDESNLFRYSEPTDRIDLLCNRLSIEIQAGKQAWDAGSFARMMHIGFADAVAAFKRLAEYEPDLMRKAGFIHDKTTAAAATTPAQAAPAAPGPLSLNDILKREYGAAYAAKNAAKHPEDLLPFKHHAPENSQTIQQDNNTPGRVPPSEVGIRGSNKIFHQK